MLFSFMRRKRNRAQQEHAAYRQQIQKIREHPQPVQEGCSIKSIPARLEQSLALLQELLGNSCDVKSHSFRFGPKEKFSGALVFVDGLVDNVIMTEAVLRPLKDWKTRDEFFSSYENLAEEVLQKVVCSGDVVTSASLSELAGGCLSGDIAILLDDCETGLVLSAKGWEKRSITEPQSETVVRGPREGFTENLRTNTAMIRRKLKSEQLRVESMLVGRRTRTDICLMYLEDIASPQVIEALKYRINGLDIDSVLESGYLEEYIEDAPFSIFPTIGYSEKPDVIAARLLEGRVAVVVDGTPFVLTVPMLFVESFQTTEDYYARPFYASVIRILRYFSFILTIFAPGIYIALTAFNQEFVPTTLLLTIAKARQGTPFPVFMEITIMVVAYEILHEAGIRMPRPVGQAISIVGALVMGDAAVSAGLVGAPVVITIAITAVSGFLVPMQNEAATILRALIMVMAAFTGWFGVTMAALALLFYLGSLSSFGVPYFDGFAWTRNLQDSVVRMPLWTMVRRPKDISRGDTVRRNLFIPPLRPYERQDKEEEWSDQQAKRQKENQPVAKENGGGEDEQPES